MKEMEKIMEKNSKKIRKYNTIVFLGMFIAIVVAFVFFMPMKDRNEEAEELENKTPKKFGATYMTMNNPYFQDMNAELEEIVEANGDILIYRDPAQDQEKQNEQIFDMLEEGITALFLNPVDWVTVKPALIACHEAGVPVFNIDTLVYDEEYVAFSILSDNYNAGVLCALDMMEKMDSARIVILDSPGTNSIIERVQGFKDTIEGHDEYEIVIEDHGMGELEVTMDVMNEIVQDGINFDVVLGGNDPTALGALAALQMNQKQEGIMIYGIDGSPDGKVMIREGYMEGSSAQRPILIATTAAEMAYDYLAGKEVEEHVIIPVTLITRSNIHEFDIAGWQ